VALEAIEVVDVFEGWFLVLGVMFEDAVELSSSRRSLAGFILMLGSIGPQFWVAGLMWFSLVMGGF
jgi:hypothetical protein